MSKILGKGFWERKTLAVAQDLVGQYLVRKVGNKTYRGKITEVEAYVGPHDLACHSSKGRTPRTEVMYQKPSTIYVYFIYGMYFMLNIVTEKEGYPAAVLIRGTEDFRGPGVLARELKINKDLNGKIAGKASGLWFEKNEEKIKIKKSPRIGVKYAGPVWSEKKYRFTLVF